MTISPLSPNDTLMHTSVVIHGHQTPYTVDPNTPVTPPESVPDLPASTPSRERSRSRSTPTPTQSPPTTYAKAAACPPSILKSSSSKPTSNSQPKLKEAAKPDNRLFIRLPHSHQARLLSSYTILTKLRASLGEKGKHIKDIQATKTGFALQPSSTEAVPILEPHFPDITRLFGENCYIEKATNWISYRISSVPRNMTTLDGLGQLTQDPVSPHLMLSALAEATGTTPATATQTRTSVDTPYSYSAD